jgi:hypothetical protein
MTAAFLFPFLIISQVSFTFLLVLSLFWHILVGIEDIIADYVHQEMTRNLILVSLRLCLLIVIKDVFLFFCFFSEQIEATISAETVTTFGKLLAARLLATTKDMCGGSPPKKL